MSSFGFRPHFSEILDLDPEEAQARLLREVEQGEHRCEVKKFPGFVTLRIPEEDRHFWSPRLTLHFSRTEEGETQLEGIYGPNANVWAMFLYSYLGTGSIALFSGIFGFVQWKLERPAWGLWIFGLMVAAMIGLYLLAQFGQKLGATQTYRLHRIYESAMGREVEIH
jgi:hypothetical protein